MPRPRRAARVTDPQVLRGLAHPLRARILGVLRLDGPSTASRLGEQLGESSGATSYHLRQLAQYGFVAEVEGRGTGRERWWQATHRSTSWEPDELITQPGGLEANEQMQRLQIEMTGRQLRRWAEHGREFGPEWSAVAGLSDYAVRLTPQEARQMTEEVYAVLDRWAAEHREPRPGTEAVGFFTAVLPIGGIPG